MDKYKNIFTGSEVQVLALRGALEVAGITPVVKDESESARLAGFGATPSLQQVFVHADEEAKAQEILSSLM